MMGRGPAESLRACFRHCTAGLDTSGSVFSGSRPRPGPSAKTTGLCFVAPPCWSPSIAGGTAVSPSAPCAVSSSASQQGSGKQNRETGGLHTVKASPAAAPVTESQSLQGRPRRPSSHVLLSFIGPALFKEQKLPLILFPMLFLNLISSHPITFWPQTLCALFAHPPEPLLTWVLLLFSLGPLS